MATYKRGNPGVWGTAGKKPAPKPVIRPPVLGRPPVNGIPQFGRATGGSGISVMSQFRNQQAGGGGGGGGGNPYSGILAEYLNGQRARFGADSAADAASRDANLRRLIISYGQVPDFGKLGISEQTRGFLQGALDAKTKQLAEQNTAEGTSVYARQAHGDALQRRRIPAGLAGRGMLRSGQTGADLAEQGQNYKNQSFDTLNELLSNAEGTVGSFLAAERARADALAQAELEAQMNAFGDWGGDMYGDGGGGSSLMQMLSGGARPSAGRPTPVRGFFGNQKQTRTALNNRLRAGRM